MTADLRSALTDFVENLRGTAAKLHPGPEPGERSKAPAFLGMSIAYDSAADALEAILADHPEPT